MYRVGGDRWSSSFRSHFSEWHMIGLTMVLLERVRILVCRKDHWKGKEIQSKGINTEQSLCQGAKSSLDKQRNWWLSSCFLDREERCQKLPLEKSPTQSGYQNTAGNSRERDPWTTEITWKYCISLDLRRTNSIMRKLSVWLQLLVYIIGIQQLSFSNSSFSYCFPPSLSALVSPCTPAQLIYVPDNSLNILCWLSGCAYLWACMQLLVLLIYLSQIVIYWVAVYWQPMKNPDLSILK